MMSKRFRKSNRLHRNNRKKTIRRRMRGKGWTSGPGFITGAPGYITHGQYTGPGKNCASAKGGRYSVDLMSGPLNPESGVGTSPAHFSRIPCESTGGAAADMMKYEVPTAGYTSSPMVPPAMSNPGVQMQIPYNAREFHKPCEKTGGGQCMLGMCGGRRKYTRRQNRK